MEEKEALAKLGAKDWRSLNKEQIMTFLFETAPNLSDEVRLKILESAPDILNTANTVLSDYQETARKSIEDNKELVNEIISQNSDMTKALYISFNEALIHLRNLLSDPNSSFEEKKYWNDEVFKYLHELREYDKENKAFLGDVDKENKRFYQNILAYAGAAAVVVIGGVIAALTGGKFGSKD